MVFKRVHDQGIVNFFVYFEKNRKIFWRKMGEILVKFERL